MMTAKITSTSERYFAALGNLDLSSYLACFGGEAEVRDPYGGRVFVGPDGLSKWFSAMLRTWAEFDIRPETSFVCGDRLAVQWSAKATSQDGKIANFSGINIFTIGDDGLILRLEGYWDLPNMLSQIT